ncbi:hypothetical protein DFJ73DRAFT_807710 [Zopfochytrium polystomum]|nr:hypothetical protein DFJ73DRAFT_807710 [Zopfochytrium polystomum]
MRHIASLPPSELQQLAETTSSANVSFKYHGGPIVTNVQIYPIYYGGFAFADVVADVYSQIVTSPYFSILSEYNTPTQTFGFGSVAGSKTVSSDSALPSPTITESDLKKYLMNLAKSNQLPMSTNLYVPFHLSKDYKFLDSTDSSDFCGYHGELDTSSLNVNTNWITFGVLPDITSIPGCGTVPQDAITQTLTHELIEVLTDPLASPNLAWYDLTNKDGGEIADLCYGTGQNYTFANGKTYTIEMSWSNTYGKCLAISPPGSPMVQAFVGTAGGKLNDTKPTAARTVSTTSGAAAASGWGRRRQRWSWSLSALVENVFLLVVTIPVLMSVL